MSIYFGYLESKTYAKTSNRIMVGIVVVENALYFAHFYCKKKQFVVPFDTKNLNAYLSIDKQC